MCVQVSDSHLGKIVREQGRQDGEVEEASTTPDEGLLGAPGESGAPCSGPHSRAGRTPVPDDLGSG